MQVEIGPLRPGPDTARACAAAIELYRGELLPDDIDQPWTDAHRQRLRSRFGQLLRAGRQWRKLVEFDPADEAAQVELLQEALVAGERNAVLRRYDELARVLSELGVTPGPAAVALRDRARPGSTADPAVSVGGPAVAPDGTATPWSGTRIWPA